MCFPQQGSQEAPAVTSRWLEGQPPQCQGFLDGFPGMQVSRTIAVCLGRKCKTTAKTGKPFKVCLEGSPLSEPAQFPVVPSPAQLLASLQSCEGVRSAGQFEISLWNLFFLYKFPLLITFVPYQRLREQQYLVHLRNEIEAHVKQMIPESFP